jgi:hypothetical protein
MAQLALAKQLPPDSEDDIAFADKPPEARHRILKAALAAGIFFLWDAKRGKFISTKTGRVVPPATLRRFVVEASLGSENRLENAAERLAAKEITQTEFQMLMQREVAKAESAMVASARGGLKQMMPPQWNKVAVQISKQRGALTGFSTDIVQSKLSPKEIISRAQLYARAIYATHMNEMTDFKQGMGAKSARRILHQGSMHCADCPELADKGWVAIADLVPIGDTACMVNCRCAIQYSDEPPTAASPGEGYVGAIGMPD